MRLQHTHCEMELKLAPSSDGAAMEFSGYGAVFGNLDSYGDMIAPGAFAGFLSDMRAGKQQWPAMLSQHGGFTSEDMTPVGVWTDLSEDGTGLKVTGKLADTARGQELYQLMKMKPRAAINGLSIGYYAKQYEPGTKPTEPRRTLTKIDLIEISPVTFPANPKARVRSVKSFDEFESLADVEACLRDVGGFSHSEAKRLVARIKALGPRDVGEDLEGLKALLTNNVNIIGATSHV